MNKTYPYGEPSNNAKTDVIGYGIPADYRPMGNACEARPPSEMEAAMSGLLSEVVANRDLFSQLAGKISSVTSDAPCNPEKERAYATPSSKLTNEVYNMTGMLAETNRLIASLLDRVVL